MQVQANTLEDNETISMDECLLRCGHMVERLTNCTLNMDDLNEFAESIKEELCNGNLNDSDPPSSEDWQSCPRLHPEDSQNFFLSAGYNDCMNEAIRFLVEEEDMDLDHPVVRNLKTHLELSKDRVLSSATSCPDDVDNNNLLVTSEQTDLSYDYYMALNMFDSSSTICSK